MRLKSETSLSQIEQCTTEQLLWYQSDESKKQIIYYYKQQYGSYRYGYVKFKDFSRTSKNTTVFKDYKFMKHTESDINI